MSLDGKHALLGRCVLPALPAYTPEHLPDQQGILTYVFQQLVHVTLSVPKVAWPKANCVKLHGTYLSGRDAAEITVAHSGESNRCMQSLRGVLGVCRCITTAYMGASTLHVQQNIDGVRQVYVQLGD